MSQDKGRKDQDQNSEYVPVEQKRVHLFDPLDCIDGAQCEPCREGHVSQCARQAD